MENEVKVLVAPRTQSEIVEKNVVIALEVTIDKPIRCLDLERTAENLAIKHADIVLRLEPEFYYAGAQVRNVEYKWTTEDDSERVVRFTAEYLLRKVSRKYQPPNPIDPLHCEGVFLF